MLYAGFKHGFSRARSCAANFTWSRRLIITHSFKHITLRTCAPDPTIACREKEKKIRKDKNQRSRISRSRGLVRITISYRDESSDTRDYLIRVIIDTKPSAAPDLLKIERLIANTYRPHKSQRGRVRLLKNVTTRVRAELSFRTPRRRTPWLYARPRR